MSPAQQIASDGKVELALHRPWPTKDGVSVLTFEPAAFLRRLVPLIPPPYAHLIRYYGLLSPNAKGRDLLPPAPVSWQGIRPSAALRGSDQPGGNGPKAEVDQPADAPAERPTHPEGGENRSDTCPCSTRGVPAPDCLPEPLANLRPARPPRQVLPWHELLRRVFAVDALVCPKCLGKMSVIAFISAPAVVLKILTHLGLPTTSPPIAPARRPPQEDLFQGDGPELDDLDTDAGHGPDDSQSARHTTRAPRAPPPSSPGERNIVLDPAAPSGQDDWGA